MIITALRAEGFMRYRRIDVHDLPARGIIAVLGDNESGKSTLGECVAFALFGETIKSRATDLSQVVSWDCEEARVELQLELDGGRQIVVERTVDKNGNQRATLCDGAGHEEANGTEAVGARLRDLTGLAFDTFRLSFYLGQHELGLLRRPGGGDGDGARLIEEIVGVAALEDAARGLRDELSLLEQRHEHLARELAVARALADAQAIDPGAAAELEREAARWEAERASAAERLPPARAFTQAVRDAVAARAAAGNAFNALARALGARAAGHELHLAAVEVAALRRALEAEVAARSGELAEARARADEVRQRIDRLIDYRTRMAQLEARLELYRNEVKRSLEAPKVEAEDLAALEGIAMPSTPAAAAQLAEARVARMRRTRARAGSRAIVFLILGVLFSFVGFPALSRLVSEGVVAQRVKVAEDLARSEAVSGLADVATGLERLVRALGFEASPKVWAALAITGSLGLGFGILLGGLAISQWLQRNDALKLSIEARERIQGEVEALRAELGSLEGLTLAKPADFGERVKALRNPLLRELFERVRDDHGGFLGATEQGDQLVKVEREAEAASREALSRLDERLARVGRVLRSLPAPADGEAGEAGEALGGSVAALAGGVGAGEPRPIPEALDGLERDVEALLDRYEGAQRDLRDAQRGGDRAEPEPLLAALRSELRRVLAVGPSAKGGAALESSLDQALAGLYRTVDEAGDLGRTALDERLDQESDRLEAAMPRADQLLLLREQAERAERAEQERLGQAEGRLDALRERVTETRARVEAHRQRVERAAALAGEVEPLARTLAVRTLAAELLEETAADLRQRVGPMLARFAAAILPRLTGGRYRKVQVSPRLEVKAYSPDKNDYVPLVDLSIGAADQLLLALRLGLGLALTQARQGQAERRRAAAARSAGALEVEAPRAGGYFLFLDEPLASFDTARARAFLELLAEQSDVFPQVFLIAHHDLEGIEDLFARVIRTRIDRRALLSPEPPDEADGDEAETAADLAAVDLEDTELVDPTLLLAEHELPDEPDQPDARNGHGDPAARDAEASVAATTAGASGADEGAQAAAAGPGSGTGRRRGRTVDVDVQAFADLSEVELP